MRFVDFLDTAEIVEGSDWIAPSAEYPFKLG